MYFLLISAQNTIIHNIHTDDERLMPTHLKINEQNREIEGTKKIENHWALRIDR